MRVKISRILLLAVAFGVTLSLGARPWDQGHNVPECRDSGHHEHNINTPVSVIGVIPIPGVPLTSFDISWVDERTQRYFLSDRSHFGVDVFDAKNDLYLYTVGGFVGATGSNGAGPNGVLVTPDNKMWAGDGNSTLRVADLNQNPPQLIEAINTAIPACGSACNRADELAYDPVHHIIAIANDNATTIVSGKTVPLPYLTFVNADTYEILGTLTFPNATNGLEQTLWDNETHHFLTSVPEISGGNTGEVAVIDPVKMTITKAFTTTECDGNGLALGPFQHLLIGCTNKGSAATATYPPNTVIMSALDGTILANIPEVNGSDEVWYNAGDGRFYLGASNNSSTAGTPTGPVLGVIDAETDSWLQNAPSGTGSHSVAAYAGNNHIFVPIRAPAANTTDTTVCSKFGYVGTGCIAIFAHTDNDDQ